MSIPIFLGWYPGGETACCGWCEGMYFWPFKAMDRPKPTADLSDLSAKQIDLKG